MREPFEKIAFAGLGRDRARPGDPLGDAGVGGERGRCRGRRGGEARRRRRVHAEARVEVAPSPWQGIVAIGDEFDAGVIVIGSRGRTGLPKVLLGSVASAVAQHSRRSVLIVHPEATGDPDAG